MMKYKTLRQYINSLERLALKYGDDTPVVTRLSNSVYASYNSYNYERASAPKVVTPKTSPRIVVNVY